MTKPLLGSLARRFATMAALLAGIAMLAIAGASWWLINQEHTASLRSLLKKDAELQATTVSSKLHDIVARMSELAHSRMIANALLDSVGMERLLIPYLSGIQRIHGIPVDILFADFEGREIARNGNASFSEQELSWLREKLPAGQPASRVQLGEKGEELMAVEFIVFSRLNSAEGALLYKIKLDELALQKGVRLVRGKESEQMLHSPTAMAAALNVPPVYKHLDFAVLISPDPSARSVDWQSLGVFFILAVGMVVTVIILGLHFGKRLTRDLLSLQFFARGVAEKGFSTGRAEAADSLEVASLAQSINRMLEHLKQQHDKLNESEVRFRSVFEYSKVGMSVRDADGRFLDVNPAFVEMTGYSEEELLRRNVTEITHPDDVESGTALRKTLLTGASDHFQREKKFIRKDGSTLWADVTTSAGRNDAGKLVSIIGIVQDITERKRITEALRASELHLRQIGDAVPALIADLDLEQRFRFHNKAYEEVFGLSFEQINGRTLAEVLGQATYEGIQDKVEEVLRGYPVSYERALTTPQGDLRDYAMNFLPRYGEGADEGKVIGFLALGTDITELKRIDRMKTEFISTVSHELRTPLTSIRGSLGLIAGGVAGELPEAAKNLVGIAKNNCDRLVRLINDILDIEKIESGKMHLNLQVVDIKQLIQQALAANEGFAGQHRVTVLLRAPDEPLQVRIDSDRLTQVLTNLLSNAVKFSPPESAVEVRVSRVGQQVRVEVADHGPGIPKEFRSRIFQKFSQADSSDTRQKGGTGLGLSISRTLVEQMGGAIGFNSQVGAGTTFFFELPEWKEPEPLAPPDPKL